MAAVKSTGNRSTELRLIQIFKELKITGWRRNYRIIGNPDFVFAKKKIAVFTDGCFWHGHHCRNTSPATNTDYWIRKISNNRKRDIFVTEKLIEKGWDVIRIWECKINKRHISREVFDLALS